MASLTGNAIQNSYDGLIKTTDNAALSGTAKAITDGVGGATNIEMSTTSTNFVSGTVDFTGSSVSGLPTAAAGLVAGTGSESIESAITSTVADASGTGAIALGDGAVASAAGSVAIGKDVTAATANTVSVKALETQTNDGVKIKGDGTNAGKLSLYCEDASGAHNVTLEGPAHAGGSTYALKFPNVQSTGTQILEADASGNLAWINTPAAGAAGLIAGSGSDSMESSASLTTVAADASGSDTIALGDSATATSSNNIAIGNTANAGGDDAFARGNIAIGFNSDATNEKDTAIGNEAQATGSRATAIGGNAQATGSRAIVVGANSTASAFSSAVFGAYSTASAEGATVVGGYGASATQVDAIAVGKEADALAVGAIAIGKLAQGTAAGAVALGASVTGNIIDTVSAKALELQTDSTPTAGGIIMSDAGGTDRRLNIDAAGNLQVDSTAIGVTTQFELAGFTVPANAPSDICYAVTTIPANTFSNGDILEFRALEKRDSLNNTCYESYWFSETAQTAGQAVVAGTNFQQAGIQTASNGSTFYQKTLWIGATNTTVAPYGRATETNMTEPVQGGDPVENQAVDWSKTQYFYFQGYSDNTTGTVTNYGTLLRKLN